MNNKTLYFLTVLILGVLATVFVLLRLFVFGDNTTTTQTNSVSGVFVQGTSGGQTTSGSQPTSHNTKMVTSSDGGTIFVKDFMHSSETTPDEFNEGFNNIGYKMPSPTPAKIINPPYNIMYIEKTKYFNITLLQEPIGKARLEAEQYLMNQLGISQADMCRLIYQLSTPYWVNDFYSGQELRFSFCPGAVKLPL